MSFRPNRKFAAQLAAQPETHTVLEAQAELAKPHVEQAAKAAHAPWMRRKDAEVIEVQRDGDEIALVNTDHAAHLEEWGSVNNPPHAPLRRGVRAAGLRLVEEPKR